MTHPSPEQALAARGLVLPAVPAPAASYRPWNAAGDLVLTAGQLPVVDGALPMTGLLGRDLGTEDGARLAEVAALNVLAVADEACGGLDRADVVKLTVFVASTPDFTEHHLVANGASDLLVAILGEHGRHARSAVGVAALPLDSPVEIEALLRHR